jgi:Tfp pilus assembly protein PilF
VPWRKRLPIPPILLREVDGRWAAAIVAGCVAVVALVSVGLASRIDGGPFPAPSAGSTRALRAAVWNLQSSSELLASGQLLAAESAALHALDQAPASPVARTLLVRIRQLLEDARDSAEARMRADSLVAAGREAYRAGRWDDAVDRFSEALEADADNELAASFLELAEERRRTAGRTTPPARSTSPSRSASAGSSAVNPAPAVRPTPGTARITVFFNSPLSQGTLRVSVDDEPVAEVPFDFTERGFLGIRKKGTGTVKRVVLIPSGSRRVGVELLDADGRAIGGERFDERLAAGSDWTLRVDMPDDDATPGFYLVRARP